MNASKIFNMRKLINIVILLIVSQLSQKWRYFLQKVEALKISVCKENYTHFYDGNDIGRTSTRIVYTIIFCMNFTVYVL
jgi:hypothetical protein